MVQFTGRGQSFSLLENVQNGFGIHPALRVIGTLGVRGTKLIPHFQLMPRLLLTLEDGTDTLSRNVGKQFPHNAA
jgi:hypothetical protein